MQKPSNDMSGTMTGLFAKTRIGLTKIKEEGEPIFTPAFSLEEKERVLYPMADTASLRVASDRLMGRLGKGSTRETIKPGQKGWWWHHLTTPPEVAKTFEERERQRQARFLSTVVFYLILVLLMLTPATFFVANHYEIFLCLFMFGVYVTTLLFNRANHTFFARVLMVCMLELSLLLVVATNLPFDVMNLPLYDLLIMAVLLAASLLPPRSIFFIVLFNMIFIWVHLALQISFPGLATPALRHYLQTEFYVALVHPVSLELLVGMVIALWARSTSQALARANRAEIIGELEHALVEQKEQLETGVQRILQTCTEVANGNLEARTPMSQDHVLWPLSNALNIHLIRFQRACRAEQELERIEKVLVPLVSRLQETESTQRPLPTFQRTSTLLDPLLACLSEKKVVSSDSTKPRLPRNSQKLSGPPG